jgi:serine/threonine-protein kinase
MSELLEHIEVALADRYRITRELGSGGLAEVFLAHDLELDRTVDLKALRPDLAASIKPKQFFQEVDTAAQLTHPNIIAPYDRGKALDVLYYATEHVEGEPLSRLLQRKKRLPAEEAVEIAGHVAAALDHAHGQGVVHRDIRPENILLPVGQAVVADFGVARAVRLAAGEQLPETAFSQAKPYHISPEQVLGDEVDERTDLYSLGATLFEMVTGEKPFDGETAQQIVGQHLAKPVREPREVEPSVPGWLSKLIVRCMQKAPEDRVQSAADLLMALETGPTAPEPTDTVAAAPEPADTAAAAPEPADTGAVAPGPIDPGAVAPESADDEPALGDLGVGDIVQGAGWDFDEMVTPEVQAAPQPVYDLEAVQESPPDAPPAEDAPPVAPIPSASDGISKGGDLIPGEWFEPDQAAPAKKPAPEPELIEEEVEAESEELAELVAAEPETPEPEPAEPELLEVPTAKKIKVPPWLTQAYDWGPELLVRLARQRQTWYYVGAGAGAVLGLILVVLAVKAIFFRAPTVHYQFVTNHLVDPVDVLIDGQMVYTVEAGQHDSLILPRDRAVEVAWRLARPRQGRQQMGEEFEVVLSSGARSGNETRSSVTAVAPGRAMFAPLITNRTNRELVALVNPRTPAELRCNCTIPPNSQGVHIGYYPLLENSSVRFFSARRPYAGQFLEAGDFSARVDTLSGSVTVTIERF